MKKYIIALSIFFITINIAHAQEGATLEKKFEDFFNQFFIETLNQNYEKAYEMTSDQFREETNQETFKKLIQQTGLTTFTEKKWTNQKVGMFGALITLDGIFSGHELSFEVVNTNHEIKIKSINEKITVQNLKSRFPPRKDQISTAKKDLTAILNFINQNNAKGLRDYLSDEGKKQTKLLTIKNLFRKIHTRKIAINLPEETKSGEKRKLKIFRPSLTADASMQIKGEYRNSTSLVKFTLVYNYQWEWLFKGFSINITPRPS